MSKLVKNLEDKLGANLDKLKIVIIKNINQWEEHLNIERPLN